LFFVKIGFVSQSRSVCVNQEFLLEQLKGIVEA